LGQTKRYGKDKRNARAFIVQKWPREAFSVPGREIIHGRTRASEKPKNETLHPGRRGKTSKDSTLMH